MGISGLLPVLKDITQSVHVETYRGQTVAVDTYCWLHKAAFTCARQLCEGTPTDGHVRYCMRRIDLLRHHGVTPLLVFDGDALPAKRATDDARGSSRAAHLANARALAAQGNAKAANDCYQKAVDITPEVVQPLIEALRAADVRFIVAPYEADAQLAYLARGGAVHAVVTEDSDLLPYGCPRVLFKMDSKGQGEEVLLTDLPRCGSLSFVGFTPTMFLHMCVLAGCDFVASVRGIGVRKAHAHIRKLRDFRQVCRSLRFSGAPVPQGYEAAVQRALWTFAHQRVFCPESRRLVHVTPLPPGGLQADGAAFEEARAELQPDDPLPFLGPPMDDADACAIAEGRINPYSRAAFPPPDFPAQRAAPTAAPRPALTPPPLAQRGIQSFLRRADTTSTTSSTASERGDAALVGAPSPEQRQSPEGGCSGDAALPELSSGLRALTCSSAGGGSVTGGTTGPRTPSPGLARFAYPRPSSGGSSRSARRDIGNAPRTAPDGSELRGCDRCLSSEASPSGGLSGDAIVSSEITFTDSPSGVVALGEESTPFAAGPPSGRSAFFSDSADLPGGSPDSQLGGVAAASVSSSLKALLGTATPPAAKLRGDAVGGRTHPPPTGPGGADQQLGGDRGSEPESSSAGDPPTGFCDIRHVKKFARIACDAVQQVADQADLLQQQRVSVGEEHVGPQRGASRHPPPALDLFRLQQPAARKPSAGAVPGVVVRPVSEGRRCFRPDRPGLRAAAAARRRSAGDADGGQGLQRFAFGAP